MGARTNSNQRANAKNEYDFARSSVLAERLQDERIAEIVR